MAILPLLGKQIKDDDVVEVLDFLNLEVIYDFDRSHENIPDLYWAKCEERGISFRFDEKQMLDCIFIDISLVSHQPLDPSFVEDIAVFASVSDVDNYARKHGVQVVSGLRLGGLGSPGDWRRLDYPSHRIHYDFPGGELNLITVMVTPASSTN